MLFLLLACSPAFADITNKVAYSQNGNDYSPPMPIMTTDRLQVRVVPVICEPPCDKNSQIEIYYSFSCIYGKDEEQVYAYSTGTSLYSPAAVTITPNSFSTCRHDDASLVLEAYSKQGKEESAHEKQTIPLVLGTNTAPQITVESLPKSYTPPNTRTFYYKVTIKDSDDMPSKLIAIINVNEPNVGPIGSLRCAPSGNGFSCSGDLPNTLEMQQEYFSLSGSFSCQDCKNDITFSIIAKDYAESASDTETIKALAPPNVPNIESINPPNPGLGEEITVRAMQPGDRNGIKHHYIVYSGSDMHPIYQSDDISLEMDGHSTYVFKCENSCTNNVCVSAYAINGESKSDESAQMCIQVQTGKPDPPAIYRHSPDPAESYSPITVYARQADANDGTDTHSYLVYYSDSSTWNGDAPITNGESSITFPCAQDKCYGSIRVIAYAKKGGEASDPSGIYAITFDTVPNAPSSVQLVLKGTDIYATAAQANDDADTHHYIWTYEDNKGNINSWSPEEDAQISNLKSQTATRQINPLDGWIYAFLQVCSLKDGVQSAQCRTTSQVLNFKLANLEVESASPDSDGKVLQYLRSGWSVAMGAGDSISVKMKSTGTQSWEIPDTYRFEARVNGVSKDVQQSPSSEYTVNCATLGCKSGDKIVVNARSVKNTNVNTVLYSDEYKMAFYVPSPAQAPISADDICTSGSDRGVIENSIKVMAIGIAAILALVAIVYMIGNAMHHPQMLDWAKMEILQVIMSIIIFAVILFLVDVECNMNIREPAAWFGYTEVQSASMLEYAQNYIQTVTQEAHLAVVALRYEMGILNIRASFNNYESSGLGIGGLGYSISPYSGDWTTLGTAQMLLGLNSSFMLNGIFHFFSLFFFATASGIFVLFLPLGFFLRSMPFMRGVGAALIAIVVGLYIFYPLVFAMIGLVVENSGATNYVLNALPGTFGGSTVSQRIDAIEAQESSLATNGRDAYSGGEDSLPKPMLSKPDDRAYGGSGANDKMLDLPGYYRITAYNFIRVVMLPTAGMLIVIVFIRDLAALMAEEVDASKLLQMV